MKFIPEIFDEVIQTLADHYSVEPVIIRAMYQSDTHVIRKNVQDLYFKTHEMMVENNLK